MPGVRRTSRHSVVPSFSFIVPSFFFSFYSPFFLIICCEVFQHSANLEKFYNNRPEINLKLCLSPVWLLNSDSSFQAMVVFLFFFFSMMYLLMEEEEACAIHVWSPGATFRTRLFFHNVGPRDWTQIISLKSRHLHSLNHPARPKWCLSWSWSWETCGINYQDHMVCPITTPGFLFRDEQDPGFHPQALHSSSVWPRMCLLHAAGSRHCPSTNNSRSEPRI